MLLFLSNELVLPPPCVHSLARNQDMNKVGSSCRSLPSRVLGTRSLVVRAHLCRDRYIEALRRRNLVVRLYFNRNSLKFCRLRKNKKRCTSGRANNTPCSMCPTRFCLTGRARCPLRKFPRGPREGTRN